MSKPKVTVTESDREAFRRLAHIIPDVQANPGEATEILRALARHREEAVREEREACARVAENADIVEAKGDTYYAQLGDAYATRRGCASAIRARGESHD